MAADTALKRYSAMNIASPWRGLNVSPSASIPTGERFAVMYLYAMPDVSTASIVQERQFIGEIQQIGFGGSIDTSVGLN